VAFVALFFCGILLFPATVICALLVISATVGAYLDLKRLRKSDDRSKLWPDETRQGYTIVLKTFGRRISPCDFVEPEIRKHPAQEK
jgi:hypothetical protein